MLDCGNRIECGRKPVNNEDKDFLQGFDAPQSKLDKYWLLLFNLKLYDFFFFNLKFNLEGKKQTYYTQFIL